MLGHVHDVNREFARAFHQGVLVVVAVVHVPREVLEQVKGSVALRTREPAPEMSQPPVIRHLLSKSRE